MSPNMKIDGIVERWFVPWNSVHKRGRPHNERDRPERKSLCLDYPSRIGKAIGALLPRL
jgi:hypothetical protein